ncbi:MAG: phage tail tube protein [Rhizobiaceae bacterium]
MAAPTTVKGGKFRVLLGNGDDPLTYSAPCGFLSKSLTMTKGLEDVALPDCDDPDNIPWLGRDATSLSITISGEGVLASQSVEAWLDAWENTDSVPVKVEIEFPAKTITWTGKMQIGTLTMGHPSPLGRVTNNVEMSSDGEMVRAVTP